MCLHLCVCLLFCHKWPDIEMRCLFKNSFLKEFDANMFECTVSHKLRWNAESSGLANHPVRKPLSMMRILNKDECECMCVIHD